MAYKVYVTQGTNRHVIKRIDSTSKVVDASFGVYGTLGTDNAHLNFPRGLCIGDAIYVADRNNHRILKLSTSLAFVAAYDVTSTIFEPLLLFWDGANVIVVGNKVNNLMIGKMTTAGVMSYSSAVGVYVDLPTGIVPGIALNTYLLTGIDNDLVIITDTGSAFTNSGTQAITGQTAQKYTGISRNGTTLYLNSGRKIFRVNSSYVNDGDSDDIAKPTYCSAVGQSNTTLVYDNKSMVIKRYTTNLNFQEDVYTDSGNDVDTDAYEIVDVIEANI